MNFGGFISGGLAGAAGVVGDQAKGYIEDERKLDLSRELSLMEEEKANRLADRQVTRQYDADVMRSSPDGQLYKNAEAAKEADLGRAVKLNKQTTVDNLAATSSQQKADLMDSERQDAEAKRASRIARASHIVTAGEKLAGFQLKQLQQVASLKDQLINAKTPEEREIIQDKIDVLATGQKTETKLRAELIQLDSNMAKWAKALSDPNVTEEVKEAAQEGMASTRVMRASIHKKLGLGDGSPATKPQGKVDLSQFNASAGTPAGGKAAASPSPASARAPSGPESDPVVAGMLRDLRSAPVGSIGYQAKRGELERLLKARFPGTPLSQIGL